MVVCTNDEFQNFNTYLGLYFPIFRIRTESNGGAWCPKQPVSKDTYEYLEIDLGRLRVVTMVETQGRFGNGQVPSHSYVCCHKF